MFASPPFAPLESLFSGCYASLLLAGIVTAVVIIYHWSNVPDEEIIQRWSCLLPNLETKRK